MPGRIAQWESTCLTSRGSQVQILLRPLARCPGREIISQLSRGGVVQLVRTPACHAGGRGFESRRSRSQEGASLEAPFSFPENKEAHEGPPCAAAGTACARLLRQA